MTHDLDPRGLEAADAEAMRIGFGGWHRKDMPAVIAAYLEATAPEGGPDRFAVVCDAGGGGYGGLLCNDEPDEQLWAVLEQMSLRCGAQGPFARQIVRCHLRRPEPPAEIVGRVEG